MCWQVYLPQRMEKVLSLRWVSLSPLSLYVGVSAGVLGPCAWVYVPGVGSRSVQASGAAERQLAGLLGDTHV